jgi:hypothetical protein
VQLRFVPVTIFVICLSLFVNRYLFICAHYLLSLIYFGHAQSHLFVVRLLFFVRCSKEKRFNSDPGLCSRYFDPLQVNLRTTSSMQVNKHHTADCTDFFLVQERRTYYDHRHSGIDNETNILQEVIAVEGETSIAGQ